MAVMNFVEHDKRGFDVPEELSIEERSKLCPGVFQFESASWTDGLGNTHVIDIRNLSVSVLPDRSGLMCFESRRSGSKYANTKQSGAFVLNEDGIQRYRLEVPVELTNREIPLEAIRYFSWIEEPKARAGYGLLAWIEGSGSGGYAEGGWYFELDYHTGKFLWGAEARF